MTPGREDTPSAGEASGVDSSLGEAHLPRSVLQGTGLSHHVLPSPPSLGPGTSWGSRGSPCPACVAVGVAGSRKSSSASELDMAPSE